MEYNTGQRHVWRSTVCLKLLINLGSSAETTADGCCHRSWQGERGRPPKDAKVQHVAAKRGAHGGRNLQWDQEGLSDATHLAENHKRPSCAACIYSEEAKEGRCSHDDSAGCDLEETTMLTDNEPALGALVVVVARLKGGNKDGGGAQSSRTRV